MPALSDIAEVWRCSCSVWAKLWLIWVGRSLGQGLRQENTLTGCCPPGEVESNSHRSPWNPLLLLLEGSQSTSNAPQGQNILAVARQCRVFVGHLFPTAIRRNLLSSLHWVVFPDPGSSCSGSDTTPYIWFDTLHLYFISLTEHKYIQLWEKQTLDTD